MKQKILKTCAAYAIAGSALFIPAFAIAETVVTPVLKTMLQDMPGTEAHIVVFDVEPGWVTDHHIHPGHVFVYVQEGSLQTNVDGKEPVVYSAGEGFYELPNIGMRGRNTSATERAKIVVFQFGEEGRPIMEPTGK